MLSKVCLDPIGKRRQLAKVKQEHVKGGGGKGHR